MYVIKTVTHISFLCLQTLFWLGGMFVQDILFLKVRQNWNITFSQSRESEPPSTTVHNMNSLLLSKTVILTGVKVNLERIVTDLCPRKSYHLSQLTQ